MADEKKTTIELDGATYLEFKEMKLAAEKRGDTTFPQTLKEFINQAAREKLERRKAELQAAKKSKK